MTNEARPAGWYEDPTNVGELRYFDGQQWTEHVTIEGVQTMVPYEPPVETAAPTYTISRAAHSRSEEERPLEVVGAAGPMGRFVTVLDGSPGYRFEDTDGDVVLSVVKPGLKNAVEVRGPGGGVVGTITKVGRLHSRYDIVTAATGDKGVAKLVTGAQDQWEVQVADSSVATVSRTISTPADGATFASAVYASHIWGDLDSDTQRLLLAVPLTIDILDTQAS